MKKCLLCKNQFKLNRKWQIFCNACRKEYTHPTIELLKRNPVRKHCRGCRKSFHSNTYQYCEICRKESPVQRWAKSNPKRVKEIRDKYRKNNLGLCRKRGRECQLRLNDKKRFGGNRFKALDRDSYSCQVCRKKVSGKNMAIVHHKDSDKKNNKLNNLITLCKLCHTKYHYNKGDYQIDGAPK